MPPGIPRRQSYFDTTVLYVNLVDGTCKEVTVTPISVLLLKSDERIQILNITRRK